MTQRKKDLYGLLPPAGTVNRRMVVRLRFDRASFDALKLLLREKSGYPMWEYRGSARVGVASEEAPAERLQREALRKVFEQIRDMEYNDV